MQQLTHVRITNVECRELAQNLYYYCLPAREYLQTPPAHRSPHQITLHISTISQIINDLEELRPRVPPLQYRPMRISTSHILDSLQHLQQHLYDTPGQTPAPLHQQWKNVPGGGRNLVLDTEFLSLLSENGFRDAGVAEYIGCSCRTVIRRRQELGLKKRQYTELSEEQLLEYGIAVFRMGSGQEGEQGLISGLLDLGLKVRRRAARDVLALLRENHHAPPSQPLLRRVYSVPWINSLWHIDGHHKLIRWKIVIHGGIDGFSQMVVFLFASDNNRASTVGQCFKAAVETYGWPSRVRADRGKENLDVQSMMEEVRGSNRGSFIAGPSTRNQRIERLWVDLQRWSTSKYRNLFFWLEHNGLLDIENPFHMWCLHFCFLPEINLSLGFFVRRWNKHSLRTERYNSPEKIWIQNRIHAARLGLDPVAHPQGLASYEEVSVELSEHQRGNFLEYGVDNYTHRASHQPRDDDPYVQVEEIFGPKKGDVVTWLNSQEVQDTLATVAGLVAWPPQSDFGAVSSDATDHMTITGRSNATLYIAERPAPLDHQRVTFGITLVIGVQIRMSSPGVTESTVQALLATLERIQKDNEVLRQRVEKVKQERGEDPVLQRSHTPASSIPSLPRASSTSSLAPPFDLQQPRLSNAMGYPSKGLSFGIAPAPALEELSEDFLILPNSGSSSSLSTQAAARPRSHHAPPGQDFTFGQLGRFGVSWRPDQAQMTVINGKPAAGRARSIASGPTVTPSDKPLASRAVLRFGKKQRVLMVPCPSFLTKRIDISGARAKILFDICERKGFIAHPVVRKDDDAATISRTLLKAFEDVDEEQLLCIGFRWAVLAHNGSYLVDKGSSTKLPGLALRGVLEDQQEAYIVTESRIGDTRFLKEFMAEVSLQYPENDSEEEPLDPMTTVKEEPIIDKIISRRYFGGHRKAIQKTTTSSPGKAHTRSASAKSMTPLSSPPADLIDMTMSLSASPQKRSSKKRPVPSLSPPVSSNVGKVARRTRNSNKTPVVEEPLEEASSKDKVVEDSTGHQVSSPMHDRSVRADAPLRRAIRPRDD